MLVGVVAIAWLIAFIVKHIWVILGGLAVIASLYIARAIIRENRRKQGEYERYCAETAAKADQQDDWVAHNSDVLTTSGPAEFLVATYPRAGADLRTALAHNGLRTCAPGLRTGSCGLVLQQLQSGSCSRAIQHSPGGPCLPARARPRSRWIRLRVGRLVRHLGMAVDYLR